MVDLPSPFPPPTLPVIDSENSFQIRRVFCVGRNYAAHAREMGSDPDRAAPFFFMKPADAVVPAGGRISYPLRTTDLHHEVELVVALGKGGHNIGAAKARDLIFGIAVGIDLTRRDLQAEARMAGRPWDMAKGFDASAPCAPLTALTDLHRLDQGTIRLNVNGQLRQRADLSDMIWSVPEIIAELSTYVMLAPGDLIFTGTPAGVGPLFPGDTAVAGIDDLPELRIEIL